MKSNRIKRDDLIRIVLQYFRKNSLTESVSTIEKETGIKLESESVTEFRKALFQGDFEKAVSLTGNLQIEDESDIPKVNLKILILQFQELLSSDNVEKAVEVLHHKITPLSKECYVQEDEESALALIDELSFALVLQPQVSPPQIQKNRRELLLELNQFIPNSVLIPEDFLENLLFDHLSSFKTYNSRIQPIPLLEKNPSLSELVPNKLALSYPTRDEIWVIAFSPSGQYLASGSRNGEVRIFDLDRILRSPKNEQSDIDEEETEQNRKGDPKNVVVLRGHHGPITRLCFSPDNQYLVSGSEDHSVNVWSVIGSRWESRIKAHRAEITGLGFLSMSHNHEYLPNERDEEEDDDDDEDEGEILLMDTEEGEEEEEEEEERRIKPGVYFIITSGGHGDQTIKTWLWDQKKRGQRRVRNTEFARSWTMSYRILDMAVTTSISSSSQQQQPPQNEGIQKVVVCSHHKMIYVYDANNFDRFFELKEPNGDIQSLTLVPSTSRILDNPIYDPDEPSSSRTTTKPSLQQQKERTKRQKERRKHVKETHPRSFETHLLLCTLKLENGRSCLSLWNMGKKRHVREFRGHETREYVVRPTMVGRWLVACPSQEKVMFWDIDTGETIENYDHVNEISKKNNKNNKKEEMMEKKREVSHPGSFINCVCYDQVHGILATCGDDGFVKFWSCS